MILFNFLAFFVSLVKTFEDIDLKNCGVTKGCLRPTICMQADCSFAATWRLVQNDEIDYVEFELLGNIKSSDGFLALSFSKDRSFGGDGLVGCYYDTVNYVTIAQAAYRPEAVSSNIIYPSDDSELLITEGGNLGGAYNDERKVLQCRFRRRVTPVKKAEFLKDLAPPNKYHLIMQQGSRAVESVFGNVFPGGEAISKESVIVTSPLFGPGIDTKLQDSNIAKAHGCLMVLAWIFCSSVGVILSRYYKEMWPNSGLLGERVWFQLHRILMGVCVGLTFLAIILAFVFCSGYSILTVFPDYVHPILGLIVFSLALINPFISFCRCNPNNKNRPYFNWIHFFVGTFAHVLSIPTMMLGLRLPAAGVLLRSLNYPLWILIFFVIFQFIVEIVLEIHGCMVYRQNKNKRLAYRNEYENYQIAVRAGGAPVPRPAEPEPSGRLFKYFMISLHATVSAMVAVILIIIIAVN